MISRRTFVKLCTFSTAGFLLSAVPLKVKRPLWPDPADGASLAESSVAVIRRPDVWKEQRPDPERIKEMLNQGVQYLAGLDDAGRAWRSFFQPSDRIAMKVNPIARQTGSTRPEVCTALSRALHENVNILPGSMVVFDVSGADLKGAGFVPGAAGQNVRIQETSDYSEIFRVDGVKARISRIITDQCTALINVPLLKTHKSAGLSVAFKNHYGSIPKQMVRDNANRYHMDRFYNLVPLNMMPPIRDKHRLIVVDGLVAQFEGGPRGDPRFQWPFNGIIMGSDPVAVDAVCLSIINEKRTENGFAPLSLPYLDWARQQGLGTNRRGEIAVYENAYESEDADA